MGTKKKKRMGECQKDIEAILKEHQLTNSKVIGTSK